MNNRTAWFIPLLIAVLYLMSPVDVAPDAIPVAGQIDDGIMLVLGGVMAAMTAFSNNVNGNKNNNNNDN